MKPGGTWLKCCWQKLVLEDFVDWPPRSTVPIGANIIDGMKAGYIGDCLSSKILARAQAGHGFPMTEAMTEKYKDKMKAH